MKRIIATLAIAVGLTVAVPLTTQHRTPAQTVQAFDGRAWIKKFTCWFAFCTISPDTHPQP